MAAAAAAAAVAAATQLLPPLLWAYWLLATGSVVATLLPMGLPAAFTDAVRLAAARGKLWDERPGAALGPLRDWSVPQRWFLHFYLLGAAFNAATLAAAASAAGALGASSASAAALHAPLLALCAFQAHLLRRAAETRWLMRYPPAARMHVIAYAFGLSYYVAAPLTLLLLQRGAPAALAAAAAAASAGGRSVSVGADAVAAAVGAALRAASAGQAVGGALFAGGNALQLHSHAALARLGAGSAAGRGKAASGGGGGGGGAGAYRLPRGGLFELVACPHYTAECLIYAGLALLVGRGGAPAACAVAAWVGLNLALAAGATHAWYRARFPGYPRHRRALIPFIY
jgi:3-oxo-5-alpha-steroid 4-dehydrogenase 3